MNDQRLAALTCRADVCAESPTLPIEIALAAKVVEARFTNRDDIGIVGARDEVVDGWIDDAFIGIRMNTDCCRYTVVSARRVQYAPERLQVDGHAQHVHDPACPGSFDHPVHTGLRIIDQR